MVSVTECLAFSAVWLSLCALLGYELSRVD